MCSVDGTSAPSFIGFPGTSLRQAPRATATSAAARTMAPFIVLISYAVPQRRRTLWSDLLGSRNIRTELQRRSRYFFATCTQRHSRNDRREYDRTLHTLHGQFSITLFGSRHSLAYLVRPSQIKDGPVLATAFRPIMMRFCHPGVALRPAGRKELAHASDATGHTHCWSPASSCRRTVQSDHSLGNGSVKWRRCSTERARRSDVVDASSERRLDRFVLPAGSRRPGRPRRPGASTVTAAVLFGALVAPEARFQRDADRRSARRDAARDLARFSRWVNSKAATTPGRTRTMVSAPGARCSPLDRWNGCGDRHWRPAGRERTSRRGRWAPKWDPRCESLR